MTEAIDGVRLRQAVERLRRAADYSDDQWNSACACTERVQPGQVRPQVADQGARRGSEPQRGARRRTRFNQVDAPTEAKAVRKRACAVRTADR